MSRSSFILGLHLTHIHIFSSMTKHTAHTLLLALAAQVKVSRTQQTITIENEYLSRSFNIANGHLKPGVLVNKRAANTTFTPGAGSEEFALNPQSRNHSPINRKGWKAEADSWCNESATVGNPQLAIDGDNGSMWHTWYALLLMRAATKAATRLYPIASSFH